METKFVKSRTLSDYIITAALLLLGVVLMVLSISSSMTIAGAMVLITGIVVFFVLKSSWKDKETGDVYQNKVLYYKKSQKMSVLNAINGNMDALSNIKVEEGTQKSLRLDVYYSEDANKYCCRLYEYVPYEYRPVTEPIYGEFDQIKAK